MIDKEKVMGFIGLSMKAGKLVFGTEAVTEALVKRKVKLVIVAEDAADRTIENFKKLAEKLKVPFVIWGTLQELSQAIGKENKVVIGIKDKNLANEIGKRIYGGDTIG